MLPNKSLFTLPWVLAEEETPLLIQRPGFDGAPRAYSNTVLVRYVDSDTCLETDELPLALANFHGGESWIDNTTGLEISNVVAWMAIPSFSFFQTPRVFPGGGE